MKKKNKKAKRITKRTQLKVRTDVKSGDDCDAQCKTLGSKCRAVPPTPVGCTCNCD